MTCLNNVWQYALQTVFKNITAKENEFMNWEMKKKIEGCLKYLSFINCRYIGNLKILFLTHPVPLLRLSTGTFRIDKRE
jgi:hypothetical protein